MTILFHLDEDGGFTAGDTATGFTSYAYPTSYFATRAKRDPARIAHVMLAGERTLERKLIPEISERDAEWMAKLEQVGRAAS